MSSSREVLFRSADLEVRRVVAGDARRVAITFDSYHDDHSLDRPAFGESFFAGLGLTAVHVLSRGNDWYQYAETLEALEIIRRETEPFERRITYGSSMGGYAAVRFSSHVGAQTALALQPQYSINPATAAFDDRWRDDAERIRWRPELDGPIAGISDRVVVFDPHGIDGRHHALIAQDVATRPVQVRRAGHSVATVLNEVGLLRPLIEATLDGRIDASAFQAEVRRRCRTGPVWLSELAAAQPVWRPRTARGLAERALSLSPGHPVALRALADALARSGQLNAAIEIYSSLIAFSRGSVMYLVPYSRLLARVGRLEDALAAAEDAIASDPTRPSLHAARARLLARLGLYGPAVEAAKKARNRGGADGKYAALVWHLRWRAALNLFGAEPRRRG